MGPAVETFSPGKHPIRAQKLHVFFDRKARLPIGYDEQASRRSRIRRKHREEIVQREAMPGWRSWISGR